MVTDIVILALLGLGPKHGYEIKKDFETILRRKSNMNTNLLYPALHRLEKQGAVEMHVREQKGRPARHLYRITPKGGELFHELIGSFGPADAAKEDEFLVRLAFFDFLDDAARLRILDARVREQSARLERRRTIHTKYAGLYESAWVRRVTEFGLKQLEEELAWLEGLRKPAREEKWVGLPALERLGKGKSSRE